MITTVLIVAAIAVVLWPQMKAPATPKPLAPADMAPLTPPRPPHPSYHAAIAALAQVRHRVSQTDQLGDPQRKAIETLTLALVAGSDAE